METKFTRYSDSSQKAVNRMRAGLLYLVGLLIIGLLLFFGCSPCDPIIKRVPVIITDTIRVEIPARHDSAIAVFDTSGFYRAFITDTIGKDAETEIKFYPPAVGREPAFTLDRMKDTAWGRPVDTLYIPTNCPEPSGPSFWTIAGWVGSGIFIAALLFLVSAGVKPDWINQITKVFKK